MSDAVSRIVVVLLTVLAITLVVYLHRMEQGNT
jgi:hypothetical protein